MNDLSLYEQSLPHERKFPVKFHEITADIIPLHWHEYTELFFCNRDVADVYCSGTLYRPTEGELIIAHSNELHQMNGSLGSYCLRVHPDFFSDVEFDHIYFQVHIPADPFIKECFETIRRELEERKNGFDMAVSAAFAVLGVSFGSFIAAAYLFLKIKIQGMVGNRGQKSKKAEKI